MSDEKFYPMKGYEDRYEISKLGIVKSLNKKVSMIVRGKKISIVLKGKVIGNSDTLGYRRFRNGEKQIFIHRMVAKTFIPNPHNKPSINHINGIKYDNRVENLEWCTQRENILHARNTGLNKGRPGKIVLNLFTGIFYDSISEAAFSISVNRMSLSFKLKTGKSKSFKLC